MNKIVFAVLLVVACASSANAQTRQSPLPFEPGAGGLSCGQVVFVKSSSCPSGVSKVTGGCNMSNINAAPRRSACVK